MRDRLSKDRVEDLPPAAPGTVRLTGLAGLADFVAQSSPELAANAMVCAVHQAAYLLKRQIESQGRSFLREGGFTESLYRQRVESRGRQGSNRSDKSDRSDGSDSRGGLNKSELSDLSDPSDLSDLSD